jgi:hypothetical protein
VTAKVKRRLSPDEPRKVRDASYQKVREAIALGFKKYGREYGSKQRVLVKRSSGPFACVQVVTWRILHDNPISLFGPGRGWQRF